MKPLPGALKEAAEVRKVGFPTHQVLVRENVSEKEFFQMQPPPWLIHLACHGFALPMGEQDPPAEALYQSGLLLGNSSPQLRLLAQGKPVESNNDGILLTAEIAALNLQSTGLVVLSACQSGLGQPTPGESFQGLVKAFLAAGAQRVANSLWSVRDGLAPELMRQFYTNLSTLPPGQALWRMQQSWLQSGPGSPDERAANAGAWLLLARGWEP
jgi:CHAT domain-containing protein